MLVSTVRRMRISRSIVHYERNRDARGGFLGQAGSNKSINSPRTRSQAGRERSPVGVSTRGTEEDVQETGQRTQPLSYQISFSEEDTEHSGRTSKTTTLVNSQHGISQTSGVGRLSSVDCCGRSTTAEGPEPGNGGSFPHNQWRQWQNKLSSSPLPCSWEEGRGRCAMDAPISKSMTIQSMGRRCPT